MRLLYRADAGSHVGTGHLFRAIRLLRELRSRGPLDATLAVASDPAALSIAATAPATIVELPPVRDKLSTKPAFEAEWLIAELDSRPWDLIVVDMLDTSREEMARLSAAAAGVPIVTFDDRGPGRRHASAIVDILISEPEPASLPDGVRLFEGPPYAVLDPIYAEARGSYRVRDGKIRNVFVAMGGADAAGLTVKVARAIRQVPGIESAAFATGPAFPHRSELDAAVSGAPWRTAIHPALPSLLDQYLAADLCLVAGGLTMFEVCCVGAPALAVCQPIDHQLELSTRLSEAGAMQTMGYGDSASLEQIAAGVLALSEDPETRARLSALGPQIVDGLGTARVADVLIQSARGG